MLFRSEILSDNPKLLKLFNHPNIIKEEKLEVMESVFKGRVSAEMTGFLKVVIEKGRQNELDAILSYFIGEVKEYKKIGIAFVTSAAPLSDEQKEHPVSKILTMRWLCRFQARRLP